MTDEEFIFRYLDKNYELRAGHSSVVILDMQSSDKFTKREFPAYIIKIIGQSLLSNGLLTSSTVDKWIDLREEIELGDLLIFFKRFSFVPTMFGWDTYFDGKKTIDELSLVFERFTPIYSSEFLTNLYTDWKDDKMIEVTEKLIK